jgi:hypothetical protein
MVCAPRLENHATDEKQNNGIKLKCFNHYESQSYSMTLAHHVKCQI